MASANNYQICPFKRYAKGMTNYPQMYWKQSLQCLRAAHVDKGVILHFSKWGFTCAAPMCWNDSSVSLRSPQLLALYHCAGMHMKHAPSARHCPTKAHGHSTNDYRSALHVKSTMHLCKSYKYSWRGGGFTTYADSKHTVEHQELGDVLATDKGQNTASIRNAPRFLTPTCMAVPGRSPQPVKGSWPFFLQT